MSRSLGVVVPAFRPDVDQLTEYVAELVEHLSPATVRVELDDPKPGVTEDLETGLADLPATLSVSPYRRGKGAAVTAGFEALETDLLGFVDADGSTTATSFAAVVDRVADGEADLAVGSRRHPDADVSDHQTVARRFLGSAFVWFARRLLDAELHDYQCGAKVLTRDAWTKVRGHLYDPGFAWDIELVAMAAALDLRVAEVPIAWEDRPGSTVDPIRTSIRMGRTLLVARHRAKQIRNSRLHAVIAERREDGAALVDRR